MTLQIAYSQAQLEGYKKCLERAAGKPLRNPLVSNHHTGIVTKTNVQQGSVSFNCAFYCPHVGDCNLNDAEVELARATLGLPGEKRGRRVEGLHTDLSHLELTYDDLIVRDYMLWWSRCWSSSKERRFQRWRSQ